LFQAEREDNLDALRACRGEFLAAADMDCKDNENDEQEFLACLEDSLDYQTAQRCLDVDDNENAREAITEGLLCIVEAQQNATLVIKHLLGMENVKIKEPKKRWMSKYKKYSDPYFAECFHPIEIQDIVQLNQSQCLMKLEIKKVVQNCIESLGDITVDVETLINVADCAKDSANFWIKNNMPQISDPEGILLGGSII